MKRFLDIILIALVFFLVLSFFGKKEENVTQGVNVKIVASSYTVPASVELLVQNQTAETVTIDLCKDIQILKSGEKIDFPQAFCDKNKAIEVLSTTEKKISYGEVYTAFSDPLNYMMKAQIGEKEFFSNFETRVAGSFSKIFNTLVYAPIYNLVIFLIELFNGSFGWAIITVTIIIRILLLWPQHKMMVSQRKLQILQPKLKEIQEKYKNDKQQLGLKVMEFYKKEKVNPMGSCGFLLIQLPILLVVYRIVVGIQDSSNEFYLYGPLKDFHVDSIDFSFFNLDLLLQGGLQGIVLALAVGIIQFIQIKLSLSYNKAHAPKEKGVVLEKKKGENAYSDMMPDPEMMNKVMLYGMPLMVTVFTYSFFAGVGIYWLIGTFFMIIQQLIVNKMLKKSS